MATAGNGATIYQVLGTLPAGLTFNPMTRVLSGTPTVVSTTADFTYSARDTDDNGALDDVATLTFDITVNSGPNAAPTGTTITVAGGATGVTNPATLGFTASATDTDSDTLTYTWSNSFPEQGGSFSPATGTSTTWTPLTVPDGAAAATIMVTVTVTDGRGGSDTATVAILVSPAPAAGTPPTSQTLTISPTMVTESATATDITATVTLVGGTYNVERVFNIRTTQSGTATAATDYTAFSNIVLTIPANMASGSQTFPFTAIDDMTADDGETLRIDSTFLLLGGLGGDTSLAVASATLTINDPVAGGPIPVFFGVASTTFSLDEGTTAVGSPTAFLAEATGATVALTLSGADASLFSVTDAGALTFTTAPDFEMPRDMAPSGTNTNVYRVTITATATPGGMTADVSLTVTVLDVEDETANTPPTGALITVAGGVTSVTNPATLMVSATATDADTDTLTYTWSVPADSGSFTPTTGASVTWTPPTIPAGGAASSITLTVTVTDGRGGSDTATTMIMVNPAVDSAPTFGSARIPAQVYTVGLAVNQLLPLPTSNIGDAPFTYDLLDSAGTVIPDLSAVIPGLTFNAAARTITGIPTEPLMLTNFAYRVSDSDANMAPSDADSLSFSITVNTVEADTAPTFFVDTFRELTFVVNVQIEPVELPVASGGNGDISYGLSSPPAGLNFEPSTRILSGTPTEVKTLTPYGYSVSDSDDNRRGDDADTLLLSITVIARADNQVPAFGDGVSIAAQNYIVGSPIMPPLTLPVATGGDGTLVYSLRHTGVNPTVITDLSTVIPGLTLDIAARTITGTPTTAAALTNYTWNAEDTDNDRVSLTFGISVLANAVPTFDTDSQRIANQAYFAGSSVLVILPPTATSGNGPTMYTLTPALPAGLTFNSDPDVRTISGTPNVVTEATEYTYTAHDSDSNTLPADGASLTFQIAVDVGDNAPTFAVTSFTAPTYLAGFAITPTTLPQATGGNGDLTYTLTAIPGLTLDPVTGVLSGTPTTATVSTGYTYTVTDADDNTAAGDMASLTVNIEILANDPPAFGTTTSLNPVSYIEDAAIMSLTLPVATGGNGEGTIIYTYTLVGALPAGLAFNEVTRVLSGTPTTPAGAVTVVYTAHDSDPDRTSTDAGTLSLVITIIADIAPAFADGAMAGLRNPTFVMAETVAITLPAATDGNGASTYTLTPDLPTGLVFDATARTITGTAMTATQMTFTYTAMDGDDDTASLMFTLAVEATNTVPAFASGATIDDQSYIQNRMATTITLPAVETGGNGLTNYELVGPNTTDLSQLPGMTFDPITRILSGRPTAMPAAAMTYTYTAMDSDNNVAPADEAMLTFTIEITHADPLGIVLSVSPSEVTENSGSDSVTITATLIDGTFAAARNVADRTITIQTQDGTATAGTLAEGGDYTAVAARELIIPALTASEGLPISFAAHVDTLFEAGGETVLFTATLPGNTGDTAIPITPATLTINDYVPVVVSAGTDRTVAPGGTIMLSGAVPASFTNIGAVWTLSDGAAATAALEAAGLTDATTEIARLTMALATMTDLEATLTAPAESLMLTGLVPLAFTLTVTDNDAPPGHPAVTDTVTITVDPAYTGIPTFGAETVADQTYIVGTAIESLTLPVVTDGDAPITYTLTPPAGLAFDAATRVLSGTPTTAAAAAMFTYTASDADNQTATLTFSITVESAGVTSEEQVLDMARNEIILPEVARALVHSTSSSITRRVGQAVGSIPVPTVGSFNLAGQSMDGQRNLATALRTQGEAMSTDSRDIKEILAGSDFVLPLNATGGAGGASTVAFWGSGEYRDFSGESDDLDWDGDLTGVQLGLDARLRYNLLVGVAVSMLDTDVDYEDDTGLLGKGDYELDMTSAHPYIGWRSGELDFWATVGYGTGDLEITGQDASGVSQTPKSGDVNLQTIGGGGSGMLWQDGGTTLRLKGEVSQTQLEVESGDDFAEQEIDATGIRIAVEATRSRRLAGGGIFEPSVEVAARHDGGDGETGGGAEVGGALRYRNPATGLTADGRIRALMGQGGSYEEWGISGTVRVAPGTDGQGLSFSVSPGYGDSGSGIQELWRHGLTADDATTDDYAMKLDARVGYGFGFILNEHHGILTPYSELTYGTTDSYRMGLNWAAGTRFDLTLLGERREPSTDPAEHAVLLKGEVRF